MGHSGATTESKPAEVKEHKPFIPANQTIPEFTLKAVVLGSIFGLIFGTATVYLALKAGLTVSASIPIAVLAIAVFKRIGKSTILENNIVQTIGSAGESVAAGVAFTVPALLFLQEGKGYFEYFQVMTLAAVGGILGVLFMVPLRRALIVKEHGTLPYPEGTACADVLVAGEKGGNMAKAVFAGFWVAIFYKAFNIIGGLWKEIPKFVTGKTAALPNATVAAEISPEYLGVGYIIGPRIAGIMVSGGVLSWLVLIPLLSLFVPDSQVMADLSKVGKDPNLVTSNPPKAIYEAYIRYIGAGAVAMAGFLTLMRTLPTIVSALKGSFKSLKGGIGGAGQDSRVERDIPITWVGTGVLGLILIIALLPKIPHGPFPGNLLMGLLIVVFGFIFVTVSSRIVGIIGSSSNPISGMTIATLMATCLIFISLGWTGSAYEPVALCIGAIVCIAAANAGATSQDLKTGFLVGATPKFQQIGLVIGVLVSTVAIGFTIDLLNSSATYGPIGSSKLPAPQATLMGTLIQGLLAQQLPWGYIFIGAALAVCIQLCGISALAWAVGAYLPISTTLPIFVGGGMRWLADKLRGAKEDSEVSSGMLFSTGLVAGGSLAGVAIVALSEWEPSKSLAHWGEGLQGTLGNNADLLATAMFGVLCFILVRKALKKLEV